MNPIQKQLLVCGAVVMLAMVAFPPWIKITKHVTPAIDRSAVQTETQESAGYSWLFEPPKANNQPAYYGAGYYESVKIDFGRLVIQWLAAAFVTAAGLLYFKGADKKSLQEWWSSPTAAKSQPTTLKGSDLIVSKRVAVLKIEPELQNDFCMA